MVARLISDFLGAGVIASRPTSPSVAAGCSAFWMATDTGILSVYNGSTWSNITAQPAPATVQRVSANVASNATGATFGATPTNGNLMIAIVTPVSTLSINAATGWTAIGGSGVTSAHVQILYKWAGAAEPTNQVPLTGTAAANIFLIELSNANAVMVAPIQGNTTSSTAVNLAITTYLVAIRKSGRLLGSFRRALTLPTSVSNATETMTQSAGSSGIYSDVFEANVSAGASLTVTGNYGTSAATAWAWTYII